LVPNKRGGEGMKLRGLHHKRLVLSKEGRTMGGLPTITIEKGTWGEAQGKGRGWKASVVELYNMVAKVEEREGGGTELEVLFFLGGAERGRETREKE